MRRICPVAQTFSLLYRRFLIGMHPARRGWSSTAVRRLRRCLNRLQTCDRAELKPAIRHPLFAALSSVRDERESGVRNESEVKPARLAAQLVIPQANRTTENELRGISTAQMSGDKMPALAMLIPTRL